MIRELKEEIGIDIKDYELKLVKTIKRKNIFRDIYLLKKDITIDDLKFNDGEVANAKFVTIDEFKKMILKGDCTFSNFEQTTFYDIDINKLKGNL